MMSSPLFLCYSIRILLYLEGDLGLTQDKVDLGISQQIPFAGAVFQAILFVLF